MADHSAARGAAAAPIALRRDGVALSLRDFGGEGPAALLLHGLAGHAGEWEQTASWLSQSHRVLALDCRGHGRSERRPEDVSRAAMVADVAFVVERLDLAPVLLVGQSLGGQLALLVASRHPRLVRALVVAEASPAGGAEAAEAVASEVEAQLARWPASYSSREEAVAFFGGPSTRAEAWASGLEERDGRLYPAFDADVMVRMLSEAIGDEHWEEWRRIQCPALVVRAGGGDVPAAEAQSMVELPDAQLVELDDAGHELHLEQPHAWRRAILGFQPTRDQRPG
ncbi:MAG: alpha/beta fold hydrolase [Solirubrobacterales bacterium]